MIRGLYKYMGIKDPNKDASYDKRISTAIMAPSVVLTLQYLILVLMDLMGTTIGSRIQIFSKIVVAVLFLYALPIVIHRHRNFFIITYIAWIFIFLLHYLIFPKNRTYQIELLFPFFFTCLPAFIYSFSIHDLNVLGHVMLKASYIILFVGVCLGLLVLCGKVSIGTYSMALGYYLLVPAVTSMNIFFDNPSVKGGILLLLPIFLILALGSRGPLMCLGVFLLLKLLQLQKNFLHINITTRLPITTVPEIIVLGFIGSLTYIQNLLLKFGIRSRTVSLLLRPGVHLSGRDKLYKKIITQIINNPFSGIGIAGDRFVLNGTYAHNILIELVANYGIIIGTLIIFGFLIFLYRLFFCSHEDDYDIYLIWASIGFIPLLVSGSYLTDINFWIFFGLIIGRYQVKHVELGI